MSFSSDTRKELTTLRETKKCCQLALITGFLRFAGSITLEGGRMGIKVSTKNPAVARLFISSVKDYFGAKTSLTAEYLPVAKGRVYTLYITPDMNAEAILRETGILGVKEGGNYISDGISQGVVRKRCCKKAALRGIFLASGTVSDPNKSYHLELVCETAFMAAELKRLMAAVGLRAKIAERRGKFIVYLKDSEQISDFLGLIGASGRLLRFQSIMVTKEVRNTANRIANCENANLDKSVNAAQRQLADIRYIEEEKGLDFLPEKLRDAAMLRLKHQELSLSELSELSEPRIGKSGLNHRFSRIAAIAEELRNLG